MKSRKPPAVVAVLLFATLSGCASAPRGTTDAVPERLTRPAERVDSWDAYAGIPAEDIQRAGTEVEFLWDAKDPMYGYRTTPVTARVRIDSIDGGRAFSPISGQAVFPQTFGTMTVREVYKGGVTSGEQLRYSRAGGIVTFDEYWDGLNQQQRDKGLAMNGGERPPHKKYVQEKVLDDVEVEAGKDYLVHLVPLTSADGRLREYAMTGFQFGLRAVRGSGAWTMVRNNVTGTWENLGDVVELR